MGLSLITPPVGAVVPIAAVRTYCGVEDESRDDLLADLLLAAEEHVGGLVGQGLGAAGYRLTLDAFSDAIELPIGPVTGVAAVGYYDAEGLAATVDAGDYALDLVSRPQWVVLNEDASWPETLGAVNAVWVEFTAGYTADTLPQRLSLAVKMLVAHWFVNRGVMNVGNVTSDLTHSVKALTDSFRRIVI